VGFAVILHGVPKCLPVLDKQTWRRAFGILQKISTLLNNNFNFTAPAGTSKTLKIQQPQAGSYFLTIFHRFFRPSLFGH